MCDPITMSVAAAANLSTLAAGALVYGGAATVLGAGVSAYGAIQQGKAAQNAATYQAQINKNNALIADYQAKDALKRGDIAEKQHRVRVAKIIGQQKTAFATGNVALDSGSPLDVIGDTAQLGELDALTIRYNHAQEAKGYKQQAQNFRNQATLNYMEGSAQRQAGNINAFTTVLGGASSVGNSVATFAT